MIEKLKGIEERFIKLEQLLSDPAVLSDQKKYQEYLIEHGELNKIVPKFREYEGFLNEHKEAKELLKDSDLEIRAMAKEEIPELESNIDRIKAELNILLIPKDPRDDKNVLLEIRAGTGGEEAGIFAGDLFRMYSRYVESQRWNIDIIEKNVSSSGGFKEIVAQINGKGVEEFVYNLLTNIFNAADTAPIVIDEILKNKSHDPGEKAQKIEDKNEWTKEKIIEKASKITSDKGPDGDFDD